MDNPGTTQTMELPPMAQLARKMANIMGQLKRLRQGGQNSQGWTFTSIDDITDAIRALMAEHGIALFSKMLTASEVKDGKVTRATVNMEFELVCADTGISKVMQWTGSAEDHSDKAMNKAAVYAEKFWLKSTFLVSTGKDPDATSPRLDKRNEQPRQQPQRPPEQSKPTANGRHVDMQTGEVLNPPAPAVVENRKPTPVPSTLTHFSDFPDKRQYVVNLAIENLFLESGDTWEDLLLLCDLTAETVRNIATGQELGKLVESKAMALFRQNHPDAGKPPAALPAKNGFVIVSEAVCLDGKAEFVADVGKLTVSRKRLIEMLEAGDVHEQFNGKAQIDAMNLREWGENGTALADCSHSFPPLKLVYRVDNGGNGGVVLVVTDAQPVTDWRNKTVDVKPDADAEKQAARELDEIPF